MQGVFQDRRASYNPAIAIDSIQIKDGAAIDRLRMPLRARADADEALVIWPAAAHGAAAALPTMGRPVGPAQQAGKGSSADPGAAGAEPSRGYLGAAGVKPPCTPSAPPVPSPPFTVCAR